MPAVMAGIYFKKPKLSFGFFVYIRIVDFLFEKIKRGVSLTAVSDLGLCPKNLQPFEKG